MNYTIKTQTKQSLTITTASVRALDVERVETAASPSSSCVLACLQSESWAGGRASARGGGPPAPVLLIAADEPTPVKARSAERVQRASRRDLELPQLSDIIERPRLTY